MLANDNVEAVFLDELYSMLKENTLVLPTLPEMAIRIRDLAEDPDSSMADISKVINKDPALAARVMQIANSPAFRTRTPFSSVDAAVMRLGGAMIKNIVTASVMEQLFQSTSDVTDFLLRKYWNHATEVSQRAIVLASEHRHLQADQAMLAGLIHDIGVLPIISLAEDYPQLLVARQQLDHLLHQAHLEIGTAILKQWCFGDDMIGMLAHHENLQYDHEGPANLTDLIIVSNLQSEHKHADLHAIKNLKAIPAFSKFGITQHAEPLAKSA